MRVERSLLQDNYSRFAIKGQKALITNQSLYPININNGKWYQNKVEAAITYHHPKNIEFLISIDVESVGPQHSGGAAQLFKKLGQDTKNKLITNII